MTLWLGTNQLHSDGNSQKLRLTSDSITLLRSELEHSTSRQYTNTRDRDARNSNSPVVILVDIRIQNLIFNPHIQSDIYSVNIRIWSNTIQSTNYSGHSTHSFHATAYSAHILKHTYHATAFMVFWHHTHQLWRMEVTKKRTEIADVIQFKNSIHHKRSPQFYHSPRLSRICLIEIDVNVVIRMMNATVKGIMRRVAVTHD